MAVDPSVLSSASALWRNTVGGGSNSETYATTFQTASGDYTFVPESVINQGLSAGGNDYWFPYLLNKGNLDSFLKSSSYVDLSNVPASSITSVDTWGNWVGQRTGQSMTGYLIAGDSALIDGQVNTASVDQIGTIKGLATDSSGNLIYATTGGHGSEYINAAGEVHDPYTTYSSWLGDTFGSLGQNVADFVNSDAGKLAMLVGGAYAGGAFDPASAAGDLAPASALDVSGADMVTGGMSGVAPTAAAAGTAATLAPPSALDVSGADMVTGNMAGVAPTTAASLLPAGITAEQLAAEEAAAKASMEGITAEQVGTGAAAAAGASTSDLLSGLTTGNAALDALLGTMAGGALASTIAGSGGSSSSSFDPNSITKATPASTSGLVAPTMGNSSSQLDLASNDVMQRLMRGRSSTILTGGQGEDESKLSTSQILLGK